MNHSLRILYITQFFPPEIGAASVRAKELAENWATDGHRVTVLTGFPNYLEGKIFQDYKNRMLKREVIKGYVLARVYTLPSPKGFVLRRVFGQIAFLIFSMLGGMRLGRFDVVIVSSPPMISVLAGWLISRFRRARFVFEVRDLYPETAVALGVIKNRFLIRILSGMESFYYHRADKVVAVTEGIYQYILKRGISNHRIIKATNGVNTSMFDCRPSSKELRKAWGLDGLFIVQYAGLLGLAQGLDAVLNAAKILLDRKEIVFVLVGEGVEKDGLVRQAAEMELTNVRFFPGQALERVPEVMSSADVGLALKKKMALNQGAIPVKMFEYMSCRRPVIVGGAAEAEALVNEAQAGICVDPDDSVQLAGAIRNFFTDRAMAARCGMNGRAFVEKGYSRQKISRQYAQVLTELVYGPDVSKGGGLPDDGPLGKIS